MSNLDIPVRADHYCDFITSKLTAKNGGVLYLNQIQALKLHDLLFDVSQIDPREPLIWGALNGADQRDLCDELSQKARATKDAEFREKAAKVPNSNAVPYKHEEPL